MLKIKPKFSKIIVFILALLVILSSVTFNVARADDVEYPFDYTNVLDDLESSGQYNVADYPYDPNGISKSPGIMNFIEWCYSPFKPDDFALYVYFYNPQNLKIDEDSPSNRIQMATAYKTEAGEDTMLPTVDTVPSDYDTFKLVFCNKSERSGFEGLFYKFRIVDQVSADGLTVQERVYQHERRYDVSGITLYTDDGTGKEYTVGGTYIFEGYAKGYGPDENAESTLKNTKFLPLETLRLEVHHTNYRTESSSQGAGHQNDLNSVYFTIPNRYLNNYGKLQKIKAEWHEYETQPIYVFDDEYFYEKFYPYIGYNLNGGQIDEIPDYFIGKHSNVYVKPPLSGGSYSDYYYNVYNPFFILDGVIESRRDCIYYMFLGDFSQEILVTSSQLQNYVENYTASAENGYLPVKNGKISADLFKSELEDGTNGTFNRVDVPYVGDDVHYKRVEFDANDKFDILSEYDSIESGFLRWWYRLWGGNTEEDINDIKPIIYGSDIDNQISNSDEVIAKNLLLNEKDVKEFKSVYDVGKQNDETTVLFRFAQTDYCVEEHRIIKADTVDGRSKDTGERVQVAEETVFLDFKIITLTFQDDNAKYTVIPVTQDPIDIYNDITHNPDPIPAWKVWLALAFLAIVGVAGGLIVYKLSGIASGAGKVAMTIAYTSIFVLAFSLVYLVLGMGAYLVALL